jgi:hypothetical protein
MMGKQCRNFRLTSLRLLHKSDFRLHKKPSL